MSETGKVTINKLSTGIDGLDLILGGGIPEYSFNLIAGEPGSGKTTLAQQFVFRNATPERSALFFTVLGEPTVKMLRYQQQYSFFEPDKVGECIRFVNLSDEAVERGLEGVLDRIVREVEASGAGIVVVDSFRSLVGAASPHDGLHAYGDRSSALCLPERLRDPAALRYRAECRRGLVALAGGHRFPHRRDGRNPAGG